MSVIVTAAPMTLMAALGHIIPLLVVASSGTVASAAVNALAVKALSYEYKPSLSQAINKKFHIDIDTMNKIFNKELKTNIMDRETLLKTLDEHGAEIVEDEDDKIICLIDNLTMKFTKIAESEPYNLYIEYHSEEQLNTIVNELDEEYKANVQEVSYNQIKENLEAKNYTIEQEEILEDNTIVLTVNLE